MNTENEFIKYLITVFSFLLIYSSSYFHYIIPGSDTNQFYGYTEAFIKSEDLSVSDIYYYYQWPLFFLLNRVTMITMNIDLALTSHFIYLIMGIIISSLIYKYAADRSENGYISVMFFTIIFGRRLVVGRAVRIRLPLAKAAWRLISRCLRMRATIFIWPTLMLLIMFNISSMLQVLGARPRL